VDLTPPSPRVKVRWLEVTAGFSALIAFLAFELLLNAWIHFSGDWDGPLGLVNGRSGRVWLVIETAWTYLVPLIVVLTLSVASTLGCLLGWVIRDARR
jgi:hypothetical protein